MAQSRIRQFMIILICLAGLAVVITTVFFTMIYPNQTIDYIEIHGLDETTVLPAETEEYLNRLKGIPYPDVDVQKIETYIEHIGIVESAEVIRKYPGSLYITIEAKRPIAVLSADLDGTREQRLVITSDGRYFLGYEELETALAEAVPFIDLSREWERDGIETEVIQDALRYIPMLNEIKNSAPDIYNLISEVKYGTNNSREITIGLTYIGIPLDFILYNPISGVRLEEAIRAALYIGKSESSDSPVRYQVFDTYMIASED